VQNLDFTTSGAPRRPDGWIHCDIVLPKAGKPISVQILRDYWPGLWTHWDQRSRLCYGRTSCPYCRNNHARRWVGFVPAYQMATRKPIILQLTPRVAELLVEARARNKTLAGCVWTVARLTDKNNSPTTLRRDPLPRDPVTLPAPFSVMASVLYTYGLEPDECVRQAEVIESAAREAWLDGQEVSNNAG
jgi:hypothetical protein